MPALVSVIELPRDPEAYNYGQASRTADRAPDRTPPQDIPAEQSVIGAMLLSKDAIADCVETLRESDFYLPKHQAVFAAILDLYGRGEPADAVTVSGELTRTGEIGRIGGAPYLHTLVASVPTAANADYYAKIVKERAILRRLVEAGTRITQLAYAGEGDVDVLVDRAQAAVYDVTDRRTSEDYLPLSEIMPATLEEIDAIASRGGTLAGVPTGFADLDKYTNGLHPGQMIVIAARPAIGKSTIGLDLARSASIKHGLTSAIFSLEMSRNEIAMRLLSAEASIALNHLRGGTMSDADWQKLARKMSAVAEAPLFIDDSPNLTMMEIRAKCRRLKQRHDLRLVVIDYLQLMSSGKKVESRQQEVSEFSRSIKLLAKELEVPVVAISQLNRGPEQRTDKRPMISDLRESGCLPASTRIVRADTGQEVSLGELHASGARDVPVWSLDDSLRYRARTMTHVFATGHREVFELRTASGKSITATANHPFLTADGWRALGDLAPGVRLGVPRHLPTPLTHAAWAASEVVLLAQRCVGFGLPSHRKFLPAAVFSLPKDQIRLFLHHLWVAAGSVSIDESGQGGRVHFTATSRRLCDDISRLLLRFGISCQVGTTNHSLRRDRHTIEISGCDDQRRFLGEIGVHGALSVTAEGLLTIVRANSLLHPDANATRVWEQVGDVLSEQHAAGGERLGAVASVLEAVDLELFATNDILWDEIVSITSVGTQDVFDATVMGTHNFVADGIAVHNSIEQDADMVILLHREDAYERESPRAGEADIILAKHRNGPTANVTVAFQGHYSRFVDMAQT